MHQRKLSWWQNAYHLYRRPEILSMFFLGFSAGLPFLLIFSTLGARLRMDGVNVLMIGYFSWIGILYSIKFFWAPIVDQFRLPVLSTYLGQRRSWLIVAQVFIMLALLAMAFVNPLTQIKLLALLAMLVALGAATQDIVVDAFRIESAEIRFQAAMASMYMMGYRAGLLLASAGALFLAGWFSWKLSYAVMSLLMSVGILCVLLRPEPHRLRVSRHFLSEPSVKKLIVSTRSCSPYLRKFLIWFQGMMVCPIYNFFQRFGYFAIVLLIFIATFRISDISMAAMANPLYVDLGFSATQIGIISGAFGLAMTILGSLLGGILATHWKLERLLLIAAILTASTNLLFALLAITAQHTGMLILTITADNLSNGIASTIFIAFLSSLTALRYTATQYALFSSLMTLPGKIIGGFSGKLVESFGYPTFFILVALLGIPAILLSIWIARHPFDKAIN